MTKRQRAMLRRIQWHWERYGFAPASRDFLGLCSSTSVVNYNLRILREQGLVEYVNGYARTVRLTDAGRDALGITPPQQLRETALKALEEAKRVEEIGI